MTEVNVVYRTSKPRYMVESLWSGGWEVGWAAEKGFASLDDAREYADDQQAIFPDAKFRVVDNEA